MKIATYNIWNNEEMNKRYQQIQDEIQAVDADILGLQEVTVDRIYILDDWSEYAFNDVQIFGTEVSPISGLCASDHYGVVADIGFRE